MPTTIVIDGVTLTLKKYPEFAAGTPTATDITLFSDPVNGDLFKTTMDNLIANILNVDGVTITGDGSSGSPLVGSGISGITADNGLTASTATNVRLGQDVGAMGNPAALLSDREIPTGTHFIYINGGDASPNITLIVSTTGPSAWFTSSSKGAVLATAQTNGFNVYEAQASNGAIPYYGSFDDGNSNTVNTGIKLFRNYSAAGANGIGASVDIYVKTSASQELSNQFISKWTDAADATRTSQFIITGVLSASTVDLMKLNGDGSWQITPITATAASAITPAEGMMLFVSTTDATFTSIGFWGYANGAWAAF